MKILKGYVKNHYRSEASMIERYITEESIEFCLEYMSKANPIGLPANSWHMRSTSKCLCGVNIVSKSRSEVLQAHLFTSKILRQNIGMSFYTEKTRGGHRRY